jgi:type II secretory pathway component PulK
MGRLDELRARFPELTRKRFDWQRWLGPALSRQIIAGRPWQRVEDLERIQGIGPYTLNSIRPYVKVSGETERR